MRKRDSSCKHTHQTEAMLVSKEGINAYIFYVSMMSFAGCSIAPLFREKQIFEPALLPCKGISFTQRGRVITIIILGRYFVVWGGIIK